MKLLLDTHIALWAAAGSPKLPDAARSLMADPHNEVWVSTIVPWEVTIKHSIGKLGISGWQALQAFRDAGYQILDVKEHHVSALHSLELDQDHKDPFDRMLVAQATHEGMILLTADTKMARYAPVTHVL
ncbi:PIN domain protein [compost metagenome]